MVLFDVIKITSKSTQGFCCHFNGIRLEVEPLTSRLIYKAMLWIDKKKLFINGSPSFKTNQGFMAKRFSMD